MINPLFCRIEFASWVKAEIFFLFWETYWAHSKIDGDIKMFRLSSTNQAIKADFFSPAILDIWIPIYLWAWLMVHRTTKMEWINTIHIIVFIPHFVLWRIACPKVQKGIFLLAAVFILIRRTGFTPKHFSWSESELQVFYASFCYGINSGFFVVCIVSSDCMY